MKLRKLMAAVTAGAIAVSMMAITSFAADTHDLTAELLTLPANLEEGTGNFVAAGSPTFEAVDGKLKVSGRTANWNAVDLMYTNMVAGEAYTLEVSFAADYATEFIIGQADSPWGVITSADAGKEVTLTWDFVLGEGQADQNRVRLQTSDGNSSDYYITSVKLTGTLNGAAPAEEAAETEAEAEETEEAPAEDEIEEAEEAEEEEVEEEVVEEEEEEEVVEEEEEEEEEEVVEEDEEEEEEAVVEETTVAAAAETTAAAATVNTAAATAADKASADTGVAGVAAVAGLAILATGAIVISRKK